MNIEERTSSDIILPKPGSCDAVLQRLQMLQAPKQPMLSDETRMALQYFSHQLSAQHSNGVTYESLANALGQCGIHVGSGELEAYLRSRISVQAETPVSTVLPSVKRNAIEVGLRTALDTGKGLFLQYQPQIDLDSGEIIGAEALVRWRNGSVLVNPADFIPVAEQCGLIGEIGSWVMREACAEAARWRGLGLGKGKGINISVNLSVKQFSEQLVANIGQVLKESGLDTDLFSVEITESFLASDKAHGILKAIQDMGVQIAIDDFGTGYSCLSRVSALPLNTIKIDREFVIPLGSCLAADAVAETIIAMANKLGMKTIAEGVETLDQAHALKSLGCKIAQGFLYAMPLTSGEFIEFAQKREKSLQIL